MHTRGLRPGGSWKRVSRSQCCGRMAWTRGGEGRELLTYFPWAPCHVQAGRVLPCQRWQCPCQRGAAHCTRCPGTGLLPFLRAQGRCGASPGALHTRGWLAQPGAGFPVFRLTLINVCSTSRSQCLSSSHPKHGIWAGSCSKRGCEQCYLSCRLFPLTA